VRAFVLLAAAGRAEGPHFRFRGASGVREWPRLGGALLGPAGAWNALWRLGWPAHPVEPSALATPSPGDRLFVAASGPLENGVRQAVETWLDRGGSIVATGPGEAWSSFLPGVRLESAKHEHPYAALALLLPARAPEVLTPPGWSYVCARGAESDVERLGGLAALHGERQTPARALVSALEDAPAALRRGRFLYLNGDPFTALQAWLQGQEDLGPWLAWRHRLFWLDEHVASLGRLLAEWGGLPPETSGPGVAELPPTTVVLRHDLDSSRDTAYLDEEVSRGFGGVHGILKDANTRFWVERLRGHDEQEASLHYNTLDSSWVGRRVEAVRGAGSAYRAARRDVTGAGLLRQVRWARSRGIGIQTLLRHGAFLVYPEWVDALHEVFEREPAVRGGSSLFRAQALRWGVDRVDGIRGSIAEFPDPQFPFWFPFRLAHAGLGGRMLRGWESTSVMEAEPELVEQMLDYVVPGIPQRVLTLGYHPAHASRPTFAREGVLPWFRRLLDRLRERGVAVRTLRDVYGACDGALGDVRSP